jgi:hypothetical protein
MTWVRSASYTGWKKYVGGKVHYLGADRRQAEIKLLLLMLAERGCRPEADSMPVAPSRSLRRLLQDFTAYLPTAPVSEVWKEQLRWRIARLRKVLPDTDLGQLDRTPLEGLANVIANAKGSVETRLNVLSCLRLVLGWAVDHDRWAGFPDWRRCLGRKLRRPHKVEVISLDEFVQVFRAGRGRAVSPPWRSCRSWCSFFCLTYSASCRAATYRS